MSEKQTTEMDKMKEHHNTTSRYYPVTKKDHERDESKELNKKHEFCECENEGMDTHTHTSRYVPAKPSKLWFSKKPVPDKNIKSNWLGINYHNEQL